MDRETAKAINNVSNKVNEMSQKLDAYINEKTKIIHSETKQSDKLGYDWTIWYVGNLECSREYVAQENPQGTSADNPIVWEDDMTPINNAFYLKDGKIQVYMDGQWIDWEIE